MPWLCLSAAQQQQKHPCIINTIFSTNPRHSSMQLLWRKFTLSQSNPVHCSGSTATDISRGCSLATCLQLLDKGLYQILQTFPVKLSCNYIFFINECVHYCFSGGWFLSLCTAPFWKPGDRKSLYRCKIWGQRLTLILAFTGTIADVSQAVASL